MVGNTIPGQHSIQAITEKSLPNWIPHKELFAPELQAVQPEKGIWLFFLDLLCFQVCYALLMPSQDPMCEEAFDFQYNFVLSGGIQLAINMLTKNNFMPNADLPSRR